MSTLNIRRFICFIIVVGICVSFGCSDTVSLVSKPGNPPNPVTEYFPLDPGLTSTYRIDYTNGLTDYVSFTVGTPVDYQENSAYRWIKRDNAGVTDTSFFFATADGLYFIEGLSASTQKMLAYPLSVGTSWSINDVSSGGNDTTIVTGTNDTTGGGNTGASPGYFVEGGSVLTVAAIEGIQLAHGGYYSGTVKIRNVGNGGTTNYYWYAQGVGLVKYVLGATDAQPNGQATGELISYSR